MKTTRCVCHRRQSFILLRSPRRQRTDLARRQWGHALVVTTATTTVFSFFRGSKSRVSAVRPSSDDDALDVSPGRVDKTNDDEEK